MSTMSITSVFLFNVLVKFHRPQIYVMQNIPNKSLFRVQISITVF